MPYFNYSNQEYDLVVEDLLAKFREAGLGKAVDAMLCHSTYTRGGRLNRSELQRKLKINPKEVKDLLDKMKRIAGVEPDPVKV